MNAKTYKSLLKLKKYLPDFLIGAGLIGMGYSVYTAIASTPKAMSIIDEKKIENKPIDIFKNTWKVYIPTASSFILSSACILTAFGMKNSQLSGLVTSYNIAEMAFSKYKNKVIETIGESKEKEIRDDIAKDKIVSNPVSNIIITNHGETIFYDDLSGRYFNSDIEFIRKIVNKLNKRMLDEMFISLNEFYTEIGLENIRLGEQIGWKIDKGLIDIDFSAILNEDEKPCIALNYIVLPDSTYIDY